MARLYADENLPLPVVEELRQIGHDVLTSYEAGNAGQSMPDEVVLAFSTSRNRAVVTLNRKHFIHLHNSQPQHTGIIVCTFDSDFVGLAQRIHAAIESEGRHCGKLVRINRPA